MPLSTMLFSFTGRLNRARFWLASIVLIVVSLVLLPIPILSWVLMATSPFSLGGLIAVEGRPIEFSGLLFVLFVYFLVSFADLLASFAGVAVATKRLHDRNKSAWWLLLFALVPLILQTIAYNTGAVEVRLILGLACLSIGIWFFAELGFLRGTAGPNRFGPDPLQIDPTGSAGAGMADQGSGHRARVAARFATIALLILSGAVFVAVFALPIVAVQYMTPWSSRGPQATLAYSDFLNDVSRNQVADVTIQGNMINGHFTDSRAFSTYAPNGPDLINRLITKNVRITAAPETSSSRGPQATLAYSDFLNDVNRNQVADVTIQGNTINGHFTDGRAFSTYAPNDPDLVNRLITKVLRVTAAPDLN